MDIRKTVTLVEEINSEYGARAGTPLRRVAIAAVFKNPLAGKAAGADLQPLIDLSLELGVSLTKSALATLGATPAQLRSYTKAALVGTGGDLEHGAAMIHPRLGMAMRQRFGPHRPLGDGLKQRLLIHISASRPPLPGHGRIRGDRQHGVGGVEGFIHPQSQVGRPWARRQTDSRFAADFTVRCSHQRGAFLIPHGDNFHPQANRAQGQRSLRAHGDPEDILDSGSLDDLTRAHGRTPRRPERTGRYWAKP